MGMKIKNKGKINEAKRERRIRRVRAHISGTAARPRLAVERSLKHMRCQITKESFLNKDVSVPSMVESLLNNLMENTDEPLVIELSYAILCTAVISHCDDIYPYKDLILGLYNEISTQFLKQEILSYIGSIDDKKFILSYF